MSTGPEDMIDHEWISDCCGAPAYMCPSVAADGRTATGLCTDCHDHCGFTRADAEDPEAAPERKLTPAQLRLIQRLK